MTSYRVVSTSLAEQSANLADVYSSVQVLPLAKAKIKRQARMGLVSSVGVDVLSLAKLVDGFILYRYDWWSEEVTSYPSKTLRHAYRTAWNRRKLRPQLADETSRTIRGRSSSSTLPLAYSVVSYSRSYAPGLGSTPDYNRIEVMVEVTPVYADGKEPTSTQVTFSQTSAQETLLGCSVLTSTTTGSPSVNLSFVVDFLAATADIVPDDYDPATATIPVVLEFAMTMTAAEQAVDTAGVAVSGSDGSSSEGKYALLIDVRDLAP